MPSPPRSSRQRYRQFVADYRARRLDDEEQTATERALTPEASGVGAPASASAPESTAAPADTAGAAQQTATKAARRRYLRDYIRWLWPHRASLAVVLLLALVAAALEVIEPLFMQFIIDDVLLASDLDGAERVRLLNLTGAAFLTVVVLSSLLGLIKDYRQRLLTARVMTSLRQSLYDRLLHLPLPRLWDMKTGGILSRLTGDVDTTTSLLQMAFISPTVSVMRLAIAVGILLSINWRLALTALSVVPGAMLISFAAARRVRPIYRSLRKDAERIDGRVGETFSGIRVVRAFGRELREIIDYLRGRHTMVRKELFAQRRELALWTSWGLLVSGVSVVIFWYGGHLVIAGQATPGNIMAFQFYTFLLLNPIWNIVNTFSELQRSLAAMERVFEVLGMEADKPDRVDAREAPATVREIRLEDVEFEYRPGLPVVRDLSVTVPGGSIVALVGRSGAGKTTVTDLVARFHDPTRGRILVNDVDIRDFRLASYRDLLALVQQDVFLFDGSVADNIAYGRTHATRAEVENAAQRANAHEFIVKLPEGYETFVGERGVKLSGGQQQRLAIARAFLKAPQILILDEATSNLDTESEQLIQAAMASLLVGRTTFVIAHRLSTVRQADLILLMDDGRIVERGTHASLMAAGGLYCDMVQRQMTAQDSGLGES